MQHITITCRALKLGEYIHRHNDVTKIVLQVLAIKCSLSKRKLSPSYNCELQSVLVNSESMPWQVRSNR